MEEYKKSPQAQEEYQNHLGQQYKGVISKFRDNYSLPNVEDETLMLLTHYLGEGDANTYLKTLTQTRDYDKAQQAVNDSIKSRVGYLPKNLPIKDYIKKFNTELQRVKNSEIPIF